MPFYFDKKTKVEEGDVISYRSLLFFWRWKEGYISYIPGVSKFHPEMEHDSLKWVGVTGKDGTFRGALIEPEGEYLQKTVKFVSRKNGEKYFGPHEINENEW